MRTRVLSTCALVAAAYWSGRRAGLEAGEVRGVLRFGRALGRGLVDGAAR